MRRKIASFEQEPDETLGEAWERFKDLIRACPHHEFNHNFLMRLFYDGLEPMSRTNLDAGAGGQLIKIPQSQVEATIEEVATSYSWGGQKRSQGKQGDLYELEKVGQLKHIIELLNEGLSKLNSSVGLGSKPSQIIDFSCACCGGMNHDASYCREFNPKNGEVLNLREKEFVTQTQSQQLQQPPRLENSYPHDRPLFNLPTQFFFNPSIQIGKFQDQHHDQNPQAYEEQSPPNHTKTQILQQRQIITQQFQEIKSHNEVVDSQLAKIYSLHLTTKIPLQSSTNPSHTYQPKTFKEDESKEDKVVEDVVEKKVQEQNEEPFDFSEPNKFEGPVPFPCRLVDNVVLKSPMVVSICRVDVVNGVMANESLPPCDDKVTMRYDDFLEVPVLFEGSFEEGEVAFWKLGAE
ncbi:uncharacterized protein LOC110683485 [Chenopodium quinoa]|uniref:uncharacterized protein LOC110683485 n=1 Tax=Chenopodium quinoa TaxID=63459 RepID=UPI000B78243A|nr:uncharacterized protein LOC110683485 [Chenopodium quinoa]